MALSESIERARNAFAERHHLPRDASETLEAFFTHHVLLHRNMADFLAEQSWRGERKILVGASQDTQLDAIVISVNGDMIRPGDDLAQIEAAAAEDEPPEISFVFVQATSEETAGRRLSQKISAFSDGVFSFFRNDGSSSQGINATIMEWIALKNRIFAILDDNEIEGRCEVAMYFVWPKVYNPDDNIEWAIRTARDKIASIGSRFARIEFHPFDRRRIEDIITAAEQLRHAPEEAPLDIDVRTARLVPVPCPPGVEACYIGFVSAGELLGIIATPAGDPANQELRGGIFSANIRSYLGAGTPVNHAIAETLRDAVQRRHFALRSNGIAVVARGCEPAGDGRLRFRHAQIVNGCQTSHTIFENRHLLAGPAGEEVHVPVKLIVTADRDIADAAVLALNRQTKVDETRVFTGKDVVDALAWRFSDPAAHARNRALFERREGEFKDRPAEDKARIITPYELARAYASVFLPKPEQVNVKGKAHIIEEIRKGIIFGRHQETEPYFLCGVITLRAREALVRSPNSKKWEKYPAKNLLQYAMRLIAERQAGLEQPPAELGSPEGRAYLGKLGAVLLDVDLADRIADEAVRAVIAATSDAQLKLNAKNAGLAKLANAVRERARRVRLAAPPAPAAPVVG